MTAKPCSVKDCGLKAICRDLCAKHYRRLRLYGDPEEPHHRAANGSKYCLRGHLKVNGYCEECNPKRKKRKIHKEETADILRRVQDKRLGKTIKSKIDILEKLLEETE
jgi:hypothetical protein